MREGLLDPVDGREEFDEFVRAVEPRLRRALVAAYGSERGREATAEALGWAWEHRSKLDSIEYPVAFLYRVAQSRSRPRKTRVLFERDVTDDLWIEPKLAGALQSLTEGQRLAVLMVYGAGWTQVELADLLNVRPATVQKRLDRAMRTLRSQLEGEVRESK